jgi:aspartokinase
MHRSHGLAGLVFGAVSDEGVPLRAISYGATKTNLQMVVPESSMEATVRALHRALFPDAA